MDTALSTRTCSPSDRWAHDAGHVVVRWLERATAPDEVVRQTVEER